MTTQTEKDEIVDAAVNEISNLQIELAMLKLHCQSLEHQRNILKHQLTNCYEVFSDKDMHGCAQDCENILAMTGG